MSEIKNGGLDQYGAGPFEQQQFGTAGIEGVNRQKTILAFSFKYSQTPIRRYKNLHHTTLADGDSGEIPDSK